MIRVFPVAAEGHPHFTDDFFVMRAGKRHGGIDIFADKGTPIVAVDDGALEFREDPLGGHAFYLHASDGAVYYGAHLDAYEGPSPRNAVAGEVLGYVGQTGNASSTSPHLHFELHPSGGIGVDPFGQLSALTPPSVTSSAGVLDVPPAPPSPPKEEPIAVVPGPVPPIPPSPTRRRTGAGPLLALAGLGGMFAIAVSRGR